MITQVNVGVGTSTPGAKLDVDGSATFNESGAAVNFRVESDASTHMLTVSLAKRVRIQ